MHGSDPRIFIYYHSHYILHVSHRPIGLSIHRVYHPILWQGYNQFTSPQLLIAFHIIGNIHGMCPKTYSYHRIKISFLCGIYNCHFQLYIIESVYGVNLVYLTKIHAYVIQYFRFLFLRIPNHLLPPSSSLNVPSNPYYLNVSSI